MVKSDMQVTGAMQLSGAAELKKLLDAYPKLVTAAATRKGVKKAADHMKNVIQAAAPKRTGLLQKAIRAARYKTRNKANVLYKVGLGPIKGDIGEAGQRKRDAAVAAGKRPPRIKARTRFYYKTLEMPSKRGAPLHPFFMGAYNSARNATAQMIVDGTKQAVYEEAARINRRSLGLKKRGR